MANRNISKITLNGTTFDIKDTTSRDELVNKATKDLSNIDNSVFKTKVEGSGFASVQICKWGETD